MGLWRGQTILSEDENAQTNDNINAERLAMSNEITEVLVILLAQKHTGMKISAHGVLGRIRDGRYYKELNYGCGEMLRHLEEMAERFYSGDLRAVDEFLQLYDLDQKRPVMTNPL